MDGKDFAPPDVAAIAALNRAGAFEEAEALAYARLRALPFAVGIALEYALACARQLAFDKTAETALRILHRTDANLNQRVFATRLLCIAFANLGLPDEARPFIARLALESSPHCADRCWPGRLLMEIGATEEALTRFGEVAAAFPGHIFVRYCLGNARLSLGDSAGFVDALQFSSKAFWRSYYPEAAHIERMWEGEPLDGKTIAIVQHGGVGDYFQFVRYAPALRQLGAREVIAIAPDRFHGLLRSAGVDRVDALDQRLSYDYWVGTYGLERMRLSGAAQGASGYLKAPRCDHIDGRLVTIRQAAGERPCIGLYWHSDADGGEAKSVPLHSLLPLLSITSVHWVILQQGFGLRRFQASGLDQPESVIGEGLTFDQTGALIAGLDGLVSICALPFHLGGALGIRTWLLAGRVMHARHENRERESVVYPGTVTIARQPTCGDWPGAVRVLVGEIDQWLRAR